MDNYDPKQRWLYLWLMMLGTMLLLITIGQVLGCAGRPAEATAERTSAPVYHRYGNIAYGTDGSVVYLDQLRPQEKQGRYIQRPDGSWEYVY